MLNRIVSLYLDFAELQALEQHVMTMNDWVKECEEFKERLFISPTENERLYLSHFDELLLIEKKEDKK